MSNISERLRALGVRGARIPPISISAGYRLVVALGAVIAALFPLAYVGLIALTGWGAYFVAAGHSPVRSCFELLTGALLVLSLVKPLVARCVPLPQPHALDAGREPLLFAFVREIASAGGMPMPSRISVHCNVNCYCAFAGGITGLFCSGFDLVIGLPLAASLRLGQFAGIVAHELGHAAQTTAVRSSRLIWSVSAWLSQVSCQPDEVDEKLLRWLATGGRRARVAARLAQLLFLPGRGVLQLLMIAESAATCTVRRLIELEADRCQVRITGTVGFISTVSELNLLSIAAQRAVVELSRMKQQGRLVDNYPGLIASIRRAYSEEFVGRMLAGLENRKASLLAAHPSDKDRIALARAEASPGIGAAGIPATSLFANFDALCRQVTIEFYRQEFGLTPENHAIVPLSDELTT